MIREGWSKKAELGLIVSAGDDLEWIRSEVERGVSELYRCGDDGYMVVRYEPEFKEMVLVLGEGKNFHRWLPKFEELSRSRGAKTVRTHIQRKGLQRWYERRGWSQAEVVMRASV